MLHIPRKQNGTDNDKPYTKIYRYSKHDVMLRAVNTRPSTFTPCEHPFYSKSSFFTKITQILNNAGIKNDIPIATYTNQYCFKVLNTAILLM